MDVFVARQPIFTKHKKIFAYELLFRTGLTNAFPDLDGDEATSSLVSSSFLTVGIDQISGGNTAFINFTEELLLNGTPLMLPKEKVMVEVLEDVNPTDEIIDACQDLVDKGYDLALDDFVYDKNLTPLIEIAKIIKVDFMISTMDEIKEMVVALKKYPCKLLAEKIETHEEFQQAVELGFVYFQGYFFAKPEILQNKDIPSSKLTMLQLISQISRAEFDVDELEKIINMDLSVSYKLLKYLNSAYFARLQPLSSIKQAIAYLGSQGVRLFVSLVAISKLADDKPNELIRASVLRARFLEQIGQELNKDKGEFFMLGLFSLIDAMLNNRMADLMAKLPLSDDVRDALVMRSGELIIYLELVEYYSTGNWDKIDEIMPEIGVPKEKILDFYVDALSLADELI